MENTMNTTESTNVTAQSQCCCGECSCNGSLADTMKEGFSKVFDNMKSCVIALIAALFVAVGCTTLPENDQLYSTSCTIGASTGLVLNMTKMDVKTRNTIVTIMNDVEYYIPATNESFLTAWTPIAEKHTQKLLDEEVIDAGQADLIVSAFKVVAKGVDYLFDTRFPKARQYQDLVAAGVHGFCSGFLAVFKPVNTTSLSLSGPNSFDNDAYVYLKAYSETVIK